MARLRVVAILALVVTALHQLYMEIPAFLQSATRTTNKTTTTVAPLSSPVISDSVEATHSINIDEWDAMDKENTTVAPLLFHETLRQRVNSTNEENVFVPNLLQPQRFFIRFLHIGKAGGGSIAARLLHVWRLKIFQCHPRPCIHGRWKSGGGGDVLDGATNHDEQQHRPYQHPHLIGGEVT